MTSKRNSAEQLQNLSGSRTELLKLLMERKAAQTNRIRRYPRLADDGTGQVPASWAQQRLWFVEQLGGGSAGYRITLCERLRGDLNLDALKRTLESILARHEVLRTVFVSMDGEPMQRILPQIDLPLRQIDISASPVAEHARLLAEHKTMEEQESFDLSKGPLIRAKLIRVSKDEHVLIVTMHHIASDGWSRGVFVKEMGDLYTAFCRGLPDPLPPLRIQYSDYSRWQREWFKGKLLQQQLSYWRERLDGTPPHLELPTDHARPENPSHRGANVRLHIDTRLTSELNELAQSQQLTLFMVLLSAWGVLLSRLSGQPEVVIGTPVANRRQPEVEGLIGFFANVLALRLNVHQQQRIDEVLEQIREVTLSAFDHQDLPFEQLVETLRPQRTLGRHPVFQATFALQNAPRAELHLPSLTASPEEHVVSAAMFDLALILEERNGEIVGLLNYATDLFDGETIERWAALYQLLLQELVDEKNSFVKDLKILPDAERRTVLRDFNAARQEFDEHTLIHELFESQVKATPDQVAVVSESGSLTFAQLNRRANRLANLLQRKGVGPDQRVAIYAERTLDVIIAILAAVKAGGVYVPIDTSYPLQRVQTVLQDSAPIVLLTQSKLLSQLSPTHAESIALDALPSEITDYPESDLDRDRTGLSAQNLVYIVYTSGSTGTPKGVMVNHRGLVNVVQWHCKRFDVSPGVQCSCMAALGFDAAAWEIWPALAAGATLHLAPADASGNAAALLSWWEKQPVHLSFLSTPLAEMVLSSGTQHPTLRTLMTGGDRLRSRPHEQSFALVNNYGPTESTIICTSGELGPDDSVIHIGRTVENYRIYILDAEQHPVPVRVPGEIYIGGAGVARGYLNRPTLTAEKFVPDPFSDDEGSRMYRSGDLARWRPDGTIEFLGRNDQQVKIRGYRVELEDIEAHLLRHECIADAVVIARESDSGEKSLVAYVSPCLGKDIAMEDLRADLKRVLPDYMVPSAFVVLDRLPLTTNGKLDRRALPEPTAADFIAREFEAPVGSTEQALAAIWQDLLKLERVGRRDNFFDLGGHSLHATKVFSRIDEHFGVRLKVSAVFQHPTVQQMAEVIDRLDSSGAHDRMDVAVVEDRAPLSLSQLHHWRLLKSGELPATRQVAAATRIKGKFNVGAFRKSLDEVVRRHAALRTSIVEIDGVPTQLVSKQVRVILDVPDLSGLAPELRASESDRVISALIVAPIDHSADPLFAAALLEYADDEHVLILAMDHLISDAASMNILMRELFMAYGQAERGAAFTLPAVEAQFADYAIWQRSSEKAWIQSNGSARHDRLESCPPLVFPQTLQSEKRRDLGWGSVAISIPPDMKTALIAWSKQRKTTLAMTVLTGYVAAVLRWCNAREAVIVFQSNGRVESKYSGGIGYFASPLFLRISASGADFDALLVRVTQEYCAASEHIHFPYVSAKQRQPGYTRNTTFNWIPLAHRMQPPVTDGSNAAITCSEFKFENPASRVLKQHERQPIALFMEQEESIGGKISFPMRWYSVEDMRRFSEHMMRVLRMMVEKAELRVESIGLDSM